MPRCGCVIKLFADEFVVCVSVIQEVFILALVTGFDTDIVVRRVVEDVLLLLWSRVVGLVDLARGGDGSHVLLTSQLFL